MPRFVLHHRHEPRECAAVFAAWKGVQSPLRHRATLASCLSGGHELWWHVEAADASAALGQLPTYLADRTTANEVREVQIP